MITHPITLYTVPYRPAVVLYTLIWNVSTDPTDKSFPDLQHAMLTSTLVLSC